LTTKQVSGTDTTQARAVLALEVAVPKFIEGGDRVTLAGHGGDPTQAYRVQIAKGEKEKFVGKRVEGILRSVKSTVVHRQKSRTNVL